MILEILELRLVETVSYSRVECMEHVLGLLPFTFPEVVTHGPGNGKVDSRGGCKGGVDRPLERSRHVQ